MPIQFSKLKVQLAIWTFLQYLMFMIPRKAAQAIEEFKKGYPVITITGPRQSGKTTLAKHLFPDRPYVSFEDPDVREQAATDPRNFLNRYREGAVFDEIQRIPDLISYLQAIVDEDTSRCRFILTGSQQFGLLSKISQSLAGRTALINLLPFSLHERYRSQKQIPDLDSVLHTGLYPPVHDRNLDPVKWYSQYVGTYLERDVRQIINIKEMATFQRFLRLCAARCGGILNLSNLANDTGVSHATIRAWISVLEASYIVFLLPPHYRNYGKRVTKTPKLYFYDTGLVCWLLSIRSSAQLNIHPQRGGIFESFIVSEFYKERLHEAQRADFYFWRDKGGLEIDLLTETGQGLQGLEIKSAATFNPGMTANLSKWEALASDPSISTSLVYGGNESFAYKDYHIYSWADTLLFSSL